MKKVAEETKASALLEQAADRAKIASDLVGLVAQALCTDDDEDVLPVSRTALCLMIEAAQTQLYSIRRFNEMVHEPEAVSQ
jgi:hypothetical protein